MGGAFHDARSASGRKAFAKRAKSAYSYAIKTANPPLSWSPGLAWHLVGAVTTNGRRLT